MVEEKAQNQAMSSARLLLIGISLCLFLSGCIIVPANSRRPISSEKRDVSFIKAGRTSYPEITNRLGTFERFYPNLNVGYVRQKEVRMRNLWLALFIVPIELRDMGTAYDVTFIHFDDTEMVRQIETLKAIDEKDFREQATEWVMRNQLAAPSSR